MMGLVSPKEEEETRELSVVKVIQSVPFSYSTQANQDMCPVFYKQTFKISKHDYYSSSIFSPFKIFQLFQLLFICSGFSPHCQLTVLLMVTFSLPMCLFKRCIRKRCSDLIFVKLVQITVEILSSVVWTF